MDLKSSPSISRSRSSASSIQRGKRCLDAMIWRAPPPISRLILRSQSSTNSRAMLAGTGPTKTSLKSEFFNRVTSEREEEDTANAVRDESHSTGQNPPAPSTSCSKPSTMKSRSGYSATTFSISCLQRARQVSGEPRQSSKSDRPKVVFMHRVISNASSSPVQMRSSSPIMTVIGNLPDIDSPEAAKYFSSANRSEDLPAPDSP